MEAINPVKQLGEGGLLYPHDGLALSPWLHPNKEIRNLVESKFKKKQLYFAYHWSFSSWSYSEYKLADSFSVAIKFSQLDLDNVWSPKWNIYTNSQQKHFSHFLSHI